MTDLAQDVWEIYGLKGNPFNVRALSLVSETLLPISKAFVGRSSTTREFQLLTNVLRNPGGTCLAVEGEIGIGKTTFVNYHRYLWEREARDKLFTSVNEIGVSADWTIKDFLMNILDNLITKLLSIRNGKRIINENSIFQEIMILSRVYFNKSYQFEAGVSGFLGVNFGLGKNEIISVPDISETQLLWYLHQMVTEIKKLGYAGIFLHFDNLELIARKKTGQLQNFLEEIRDSLQTPDVYFVFVGYRGFFSKIIAPLERVRSIFFGHPIYLPPLTQAQVLEAIEKRYQLLSNAKSFIKPVEDVFIIYLYKLFKGKIRFIMDAMNTLIPNLGISKPVTLSAFEASKYLLEITLARLTFLNRKDREILEFAVCQDTFTNKQLCQQFDMPSGNVSRILKTLQEADLIYVSHQTGQYTYYRVSEELKILKALKRSKSFPMPKGKTEVIEQRLLELLDTFEDREFTSRDYQKITGMGASTVRRYLKIFVDRGKIFKKGKGRATCYQNSSPEQA